MMRWKSFAGTLAYGALAAAGLPLFWLLLGPWIGHGQALALYVVVAGWLHGVGLAPNTRMAAAIAITTGALGCLLLIVARDGVDVAIGSALSLAIVRALCFDRGSLPRAIAIEVVLGILGLGLAALLVDAGPLGVALALWGYFLVQSGFHLIGGGGARGFGRGAVDPFDRARARILTLLEEVAPR